MTSYANVPKTLKAGIVVLDPESAQVQQIIPLQYNPESLNRSFQVQGVDSADGGDRSQALRIKAPAVENMTLEAEIDATDLLESADKDAVALGIHRELAALESLLNPAADDLLANNQLASSGILEILPMESSLVLFVWGKKRILPVRLTELSITEEAFDINLNPIRARVSLGMRVLTVDDLGFEHKGGSLFMNYLQSKEKLRDKKAASQLNTLGIGSIP